MQKLFAILPILLALPSELAQAQDTSGGGGPLQLAPPTPGNPAPSQAPASAAPDAVAATGNAAGPTMTPPAWIESRESRGGGPACLIGKSSGGYTFELAISAAAPGSVIFSVQRSDWTLTGAEAVPTTLAFADGMSLTENATIAPNGLSITFDASTLRPWMHEFTRTSTMTVSPSNNAFQGIPTSLSGSTAAINEMGDCIKSNGMQGVPPPFVSASAAAATAAPAPVSGPAPGIPVSIANCAPVSDSLARLECYDRAVKTAVGTGETASATPAAPMQSAAPTPAAAPVAAPPPGPTGLSEGQFVAIIDQASAAYDSGSNDMAKGAARPARARSICNAATGVQASEWRGTVETLSSNNEGKGVLTVRLSPHATVSTTNNALSDSMGMHTLIDPSSDVFRAATALHEGQAVIFSGSFAQNDKDCFEEMSMTQEGSMHDPEFLFAFSSVKAVDR